MFNTVNVVRLGVILYIGIGGFVAYSLWKNPAASDSVQGAGILLAGLIPALIAILPYINSSELENEYNLVIFYNENSKQVISTNLFSPYTSAYFNLFVNLQPSAFKSRGSQEVSEDSTTQSWPSFYKDEGFDLIERLVLFTFFKEFWGHWDIEYRTILTPDGKTTLGKLGNQKTKKVETRNIAQLFEHNVLIREGSIDTFQQSFSIPPKSEFLVYADKHYRTITIKVTDVIKLTLTMRPSSGGVSASGVWGLLEPDENLISFNYGVVVKLEYYPYSTEGKAYKRWFDNVSEAISKLDWEKINLEVESELMRKMLVNPKLK